MKGIFKITSIMISATLILTACAKNIEENPSIKNKVDIDVVYHKLKDIKPSDIVEIKADTVLTENSAIVDGGILNLSVKEKNSDGKMNSVIYMTKLDLKGEKVFEKELGKDTIYTLLAADKGFAIYTEKNIAYYDVNGSEVWKYDFPEGFRPVKGTALSDGFVVAGQKVETSNISVIKLNFNGEKIAEKEYAGDGNDTVFGIYPFNEGIILFGNSKSKTGIYKDISESDFFAYADKNLEVKWVYSAGAGISIPGEAFYAHEGNIYTAAVKYEKDIANWVLIKVNDKGEEVWRSQFEANIRPVDINSFNDGLIVAARKSYTDGYLYSIDNEGNMSKLCEGPEYLADKIYRTNDGGFITTASRIIKTVNQPVYISAIWYDTENVVTKYDSNLKTLWRKTYDRVKDDRGTDVILPLADSRLVVSK